MKRKRDDDTRQSLLSEFKREKKESVTVRLLRQIAGKLEAIEKRLGSGRPAMVSYEYDRVRVNTTSEIAGSPPGVRIERPVSSHAAEFTKLLAAGDGKIPWDMLKAQVAEIYAKRDAIQH